jgi:RNA polymerase sigma-70 factor (ECF subfamily)
MRDEIIQMTLPVLRLRPHANFSAHILGRRDILSVSMISSPGPNSGFSNTDRAEEFMALFAAHHRRLFRYTLALLPRLHAAEDVLQETNLVLWRRFSEFRPGTDFYAWAARIAFLQVLKYRKSTRHQSFALDDGLLATLAARSVETTDHFDTAREALQKCLSKLRAEDRELIMRRYMLGDSGKKVAAEVGRPQNSVYKSLSRIRQGLLQCIQRAMARTALPRGGPA